MTTQNEVVQTEQTATPTQESKIKLALATREYDKLQDLLERKIETMEFYLVDREICEKVDSGWMQLIPYSSISCYDPNNGDMKFLAYQRAEGSGEERLVSATSIGFGGHIDRREDITCTRMEDVTDVPGTTRVYHMSTQDLMVTALEACKREWKEEIGFDPIEEFGIDIHGSVRFTFFRDPNPENEVGQVHFGVSIPLTLDQDQMTKLFEKAKAEESEIKDLREFVINAGQILMSFDVSEVATKVIKDIAEKDKMEPWSVQVLSQRMLEYFELMRTHVTYTDIIAAVKKNVEARKAAIEEQQKAMQEAAEAEAKRQADEAAGIQDVEVKEVPETQEQPAQ